jgi:hypothetical protein
MHLRRPATPAAALLLAASLAALLLAGCGSSSTTPSTGANANASASATTPKGASGTKGTGRAKAIRECLQKAGINLPQQPQGAHPPSGGGAGGFFGGPGGAKLPKGVTREQFQAALKKCGLTRRLGSGRFGAGRGRLNSPAFRQSLTSFSKCMQEHGVKLPAPNTSGKGPVFNTSGIDTTGSTFVKAEDACRGKLHFFAPRPGGEGGTGPAGAPPAGGPPAGSEAPPGG